MCRWNPDPPQLSEAEGRCNARRRPAPPGERRLARDRGGHLRGRRRHGVRRLRIRDWQFISDSGPDRGWSLGPSSPELLCGVLSTCLTHTYEIAAAAMNIPLDRIEVRVTAKNNDARFVGVETGDPALPWDITAHVHLEADGLPPPDLERLHTFARECCPLTQLIRTPNAMTIVTDA
jgi:uncharacterized OsmC-like protein